MSRHDEARANLDRIAENGGPRADALHDYIAANEAAERTESDEVEAVSEFAAAIALVKEQQRGMTKEMAMDAISRQHDGSTPENPREDGSYGYPKGDNAAISIYDERGIAMNDICPTCGSRNRNAPRIVDDFDLPFLCQNDWHTSGGGAPVCAGSTSDGDTTPGAEASPPAPKTLDGKEG